MYNVHKTIPVKRSLIVDKSHGWIPKWVDEYVWCFVRFCNRESGSHFRFDCFLGRKHFPKLLRLMPYEVFWSLDCIPIQSKGVVIWSWTNSCHSKKDGRLEQDYSFRAYLPVSCKVWTHCSRPRLLMRCLMEFPGQYQDEILSKIIMLISGILKSYIGRKV